MCARPCRPGRLQRRLHNQPTKKLRPKDAWVRAGTLAVVLTREHWWRSVSMSGFARRRGSNIGRSGEHRAFGAPMNQNCTLWTLRVACFKSAFFASFLCRFGQRNDAPPRAVANSGKEKIRLTQTATAESTNPALTPATHPALATKHRPQNPPARPSTTASEKPISKPAHPRTPG